MKKIPMRRCLVSGEMLPKKELLRIVKTPDGHLKVDATGKLNGHGGYLKKDFQILEMAIKRKTLEKVFGMPVEATLYEEIKRLI
ncbi:MAG TPA: DUF448 domain-containing protein [Firmicutes bacterium]|jgi:hypothetical protein|nr:DUF448 domain-containing protein [Bacillota bacterium]HAV20180.1 DUF448 domain-containing protein [Bacillota bacterium]